MAYHSRASSRRGGTDPLNWLAGAVFVLMIFALGLWLGHFLESLLCSQGGNRFHAGHDTAPPRASVPSKASPGHQTARRLAGARGGDTRTDAPGAKPEIITSDAFNRFASGMARMIILGAPQTRPFGESEIEALRLAEQAIQEGRRDNAVRLLQMAVKRVRASVEARSQAAERLGDMLVEDDLDGALAAYQAASGLVRYNPAVASKTAYVQWKLGRMVEAERQLRLESSECERRGDLVAAASMYSALGFFYLSVNRVAMATEMHKNSLAIAEELAVPEVHGPSLVGMGLVYQAQGQRLEALEAFIRAESAYAGSALTELRSALGREVERLAAQLARSGHDFTAQRDTRRTEESTAEGPRT